MNSEEPIGIIELNNNNISQLPPSICNFQSYGSFYFSIQNNDLTELPECILDICKNNLFGFDIVMSLDILFTYINMDTSLKGHVER